MASGAMEHTTPSRRPLNDLLKDVLKLRGDEFNGISQEQTELAKQIQTYRVEAVAPVIELLRHRDKNVRGFAGYIARDLKGITERILVP